MRGAEWIRSLLTEPRPIEPPSWADVLGQVRADHGKGATRYLAGRMGVTMRTAQRYYTGQHVPSRAHARAAMAAEIEAVRDARYQRAVAKWFKDTADLLRMITRLDVGIMVVINKSGPINRKPQRRYPKIKLRNIDEGLAKVADLWEKRRIVAAEQALSNTILAAYNGEASDDWDGLAAALDIIDYPMGIDYD